VCIHGIAVPDEEAISDQQRWCPQRSGAPQNLLENIFFAVFVRSKNQVILAFGNDYFFDAGEQAPGFFSSHRLFSGVNNSVERYVVAVQHLQCLGARGSALSQVGPFDLHTFPPE